MQDELSLRKESVEPSKGGSDAKLEKKVKELSEHLKRYKENGSLALKKIKALTAEKEETAKDIQAKEEEISLLKKQLQDIEGGAHNAGADAWKDQEQEEKLRAELLELTQAHQQLQQAHRGESGSNLVQEQLDQAKLELAQARQHATKGEEKCSALQEELEQLESELEAERERAAKVPVKQSRTAPPPSASTAKESEALLALKAELEQAQAHAAEATAELQQVRDELAAEQEKVEKANDGGQGSGQELEEARNKVVKLQKLLRRAEQMLAENKKQHKDMQVASEHEKAKIAALEVQVAQMVTRGMKGDARHAIDPKSALVHARVVVLETVWCFLLPAGVADRDPANGVWMRQADYAADGGNTDEGLPATVEEAATEACEQQYKAVLAEQTQQHTAQLSALDTQLSSVKKKLEEEKEEFANYKRRATSVLKKKTAQISELNSDENSAERLKELLAVSEERVQVLQNEKASVHQDASNSSVRLNELQELLGTEGDKVQQLQKELLSGKEREESFEARCTAAEEKQAVMIKELEAAITAEQERNSSKCEGLREEHQAYRSKVKKMLQEKDKELAALREKARSGPEVGPAAAQPPMHLPAQDAQPSNIPRTENDAVADLLQAARVQAQRDDEVSKYQTQIRELEKGIRDAEKVRHLQAEQVGALKEEVKRQDRLQQRDHAPMEYLKNIVIAYMEGGSHEQLMPVLTMLLQLTPEEVERVNAKRGRWF